MRVLVDSSVWIEFFSSSSRTPSPTLEGLISEGQVVTCLPIKTEVLSGNASHSTRITLERAFDSMDFIDLDWNSKETWDFLAELSWKARRKRVSVPGVVDRMILACALQTRTPLWTLDKKLLQFAKALGAPLSVG